MRRAGGHNSYGHDRIANERLDMAENAPRRNSVLNSIERNVFRYLLGSAVGLIVVGTIGYSILEDWSFVDSLYFSVVAITTVGFGDLTPSSDASKLFTVVYLLAGISVITAFLRARLEVRSRRRVEDGSDTTS
jgi:hypothetical protein